MISEDDDTISKAHSSYTCILANDSEREDETRIYHIVQTMIFFACFPFFSESLCDKNSTSVARAPANRWPS